MVFNCYLFISVTLSVLAHLFTKANVAFLIFVCRTSLLLAQYKSIYSYNQQRLLPMSSSRQDTFCFSRHNRGLQKKLAQIPGCRCRLLLACLSLGLSSAQPMRRRQEKCAPLLRMTMGLRKKKRLCHAILISTVLLRTN